MDFRFLKLFAGERVCVISTNMGDQGWWKGWIRGRANES
ncbi:unnamed protein product [Protopolystoma xenopodis]|uniref:SH3 domain-containing protein n=1 Tax=Protopolystoma xenopodis TaxID=117903 RepID=A0A448X3H8_9PLAT|nr:unnamed protein product [Protopolystoma xenopodis]